MFRLLIADDHPLYRDALVDVVQQYLPETTLLSAANLNEVFTLLANEAAVDNVASVDSRVNIDLVLLDLNMPGMNGLDGVSQLLNQYPTLAVAMLSAEDDKHVVLEAMALGCIGYISKASERADLAHAIEQILAGNIYLPAESFRTTNTKAPSLTVKQSAAESTKVSLADLTKQQIRVLREMVNGASNKQIAFNLHISEATVKSHVSAIFRKLEVSNRVQAILKAKSADFSAYLTS